MSTYDPKRSLDGRLAALASCEARLAEVERERDHEAQSANHHMRQAGHLGERLWETEARLAEALDVLREGVDGLTHTAHAPPGWIDRARALLGDDR